MWSSTQRAWFLVAAVAFPTAWCGAAAAGAPEPRESTGRAPPASSAGASVTPPTPLATAVGYPPGATGDATVALTLTVDADGKVSSATDTEGPEPFATAARHAALGWTFEPALRGGRPVRARIRYLARFVGEHPLAPETVGEPSPPTLTPASATVAQAAPAVVTVEGERAAPGGMSVSMTEARMLPGAFGDPFRAVEALPGFTPVVSMLPFFFIRGAPPGDVGYYIDGVRVPLLFHALAGPAVLPPALIDRIDVYEGGYPARFGRFAGGIIAARTPKPADEGHASAGVSVLDAHGVVETPFAGGAGHVIAAGRYSYTGLILSQATNAKLDYWDYQVLGSYDLGARDTVGVFAFGAFDYFGDQGGTNFAGTQFHRIDLRHDHTFSAATALRTAVTLGYDHSLATGGNIGDRSIAGRMEGDHSFGPAGRLRFGADVAVDDFLLELLDPTVSFRDATTLFPPRTEVVSGAYVDFELRPARRVLVTPGVRTDVFHSQGLTAAAVDPRIGAVFEVSPKVKIIHALGVAHQTPNFLPNLPGAQVAGLRGGLQESVQSSAGVEVALPEGITTTATLFEQAFFNLSDPLGFSRSIAANADVADVRANGHAIGAELLVKRSLTRRFGGVLSYTLSRSVRSHADLNSVSAFDRTHVASLILGYDLGRKWRIGARGLLVSGVPTRTLTVEGPRFGGERAAPFIRVDLRLEKRWRLGERGWWGVTAEVLNATASTEVVGRSCSALRCTNSSVGPLVLPNLGVEVGY